MEQGNRKWIIKDSTGQIGGPYSTEKVLYKIGRGEFSGEEWIALYPGGNWIPISQDPQFYDKLLEVLVDEGDQDEVRKDTYVMDFTRQAEMDDAGPVDPADARTIIPEKAKAEPEVSEDTPAPKSKKKSRKRTKPEDIELVDVRPQIVKAVIQRAKWPLLMVVAAVAIAAMLLVGGKSNEYRIRLVAPQKMKEGGKVESQDRRFALAAGEFAKDTLPGYTRSMNEFVSIIEKDPKHAKAMGLLCMTYLELWPFAYQDSKDSRTVVTVVQMSSAVDPAGVHSAACRVVDLVVQNRPQEAKSLVESILDTRANDADPPMLFYFLKGLLLEEFGEHAAAIGYLKSAQKLWPRWILPIFVEAQALSKLERYNEAGNLYRGILRQNPDHVVARIELGILEYKHFNRKDEGEKYLQQALQFDDAPFPVLARGFLGLSEIYLSREDRGKALENAKKAYELDPTNEAAKNIILQLEGPIRPEATARNAKQLEIQGDSYFREGDYQSAQAYYRSAFKADRKNATAAMKAGKCLWKLSLSTEALEWLNQAIKSDPKLTDAYVTLADYYSQRFNFRQAAKILQNARAINPKSHEVYRGFAMIELRRNNAKGAISFGKKALQLYENDVETLILMARASSALKDYKMAFNYAQKAVEYDVNNRNAQIEYSQALAGLQGIDVGIDNFLRLINNYPLVSEYRLALGRMLLSDERFDQAEEIFRQIIKLDEKPKEAYVELAKVLKAQSNVDEALELLLKAAVLDPADAEPLFLAGIIYLDQKKPGEATNQFRRVLIINKGYPLVHYQLGRAALAMNDPKGAVDFAEEEKKINPGLADPYLLAAEAYTLMQQFSLCATEYQKAIKLRPQQAAIYVKMAQCYRKAGSLDVAINMLNVAATKEPGYADIYKEQGAIFELKGDVNHAIESYNQYFVLDPDSPDREQIESRIKALLSGQNP
ncbi:MAG: tetratricopeptide repeat protein [Bdellovibrionales bacterium]